MLAQYGKFWAVLPQASRLEQGGPRENLLAQFVTGAALESTTRAMAVQDAAGRRLYGVPTLQPSVESVTRDEAVVTDCQDASSAGVERIETGQPITVGTEHVSVRSGLQRDGAGTWRLTSIDFTGQPC